MQRNDYHPWRELPGANEGKLGSVKVNLTFPRTITTEGGVELFDLRYTCRQDLCSGKLRLKYFLAVAFASICALLAPLTLKLCFSFVLMHL